jgi:hypothetical protein
VVELFIHPSAHARRTPHRGPLSVCCLEDLPCPDHIDEEQE